VVQLGRIIRLEMQFEIMNWIADWLVSQLAGLLLLATNKIQISVDIGTINLSIGIGQDICCY
jgi:hypothetical protein